MPQELVTFHLPDQKCDLKCDLKEVCVPLVYVVLGVLSLAVLVLAAMMGELAARVKGLAEPVSRGPQPLSIAPDLLPISWPPSASAGDGVGDVDLVVLSTSCSTCQDVATELAADAELRRQVGVCLVTSPRLGAGDFLRETGLDSDGVFVDDLGEWCREATKIDVSPAFLRVRGGRLLSGFMFSKPGELSALLSDSKKINTMTSQRKVGIAG